MIKFIQRFSADTECRTFMEVRRWPEGPVCPKCGSENRSGRVSSRSGVWTCNANSCKHQYTGPSGTPLHRTRVPLPKWFLATRSPAMDRFAAAFTGLENGPLGYRVLTA
ncbi:transposase [Salipiger mucosus]|uniref:transposase n=1 Tax=Salipiger mucosus TaxID=263378 RepID=UPI003CCC4586